jgi:type VI secretion system protein
MQITTLRQAVQSFLLRMTVIAALCACGTTAPPTIISGIQVVSEVNANQNTATPIDIVFVYDSTAVALLPKTGTDWFKQKAALISGLATSIDVVSLQVPPATLVSVPLPKRYEKAIGVYSFANYLSEGGQPVGNLTPYKNMQIWLTPTSIVYTGS